MVNATNLANLFTVAYKLQDTRQVTSKAIILFNREYYGHN